MSPWHQKYMKAYIIAMKFRDTCTKSVNQALPLLSQLHLSMRLIEVSNKKYVCNYILQLHPKRCLSAKHSDHTSGKCDCEHRTHLWVWSQERFQLFKQPTTRWYITIKCYIMFACTLLLQSLWVLTVFGSQWLLVTSRRGWKLVISHACGVAISATWWQSYRLP